jgi:TM2 domain-containing membrane protein YozV
LKRQTLSGVQFVPEPLPQSRADEASSIALKDPLLAGILAWMVPGLGHFYQGRYSKGILFSVCLLGVFGWGVCLGSSPEMGWGRAVYFSFREGDFRPHYLAQVGIGLPAMPALAQALLVGAGKAPVLGGFMAPPTNLPGQLSAKDLNRRLHRYFELGTVYTMIAGLLNLLAIYDACCGPVAGESAKTEDEEEPQDSDEDETARKSA